MRDLLILFGILLALLIIISVVAGSVRGVGHEGFSEDNPQAPVLKLTADGKVVPTKPTSASASSPTSPTGPDAKLISPPKPAALGAVPAPAAGLGAPEAKGGVEGFEPSTAQFAAAF